MDDGLDSSMDTSSDDAEVTSYSADDIAELAAAAQEVLDAPPETPAEDEAVVEEPVAEPAPAEPQVIQVVEEPAPVPVATDATPVAAKGGCATLLVGLLGLGAIVLMLLVF
ncbi:MAG: hypothetical protein HZB16_06280 [Armatimonadetes bacterium]|nr:hypothetical protein [Armatimonadota bacterium]